MLKDRINDMITEEMKVGNRVAVEVYRAIKNEFLLFETAKNAKPLDKTAEIGILQRMVKQHKESIDAYKKANREDLCESEQKELDILSSLLPATPKEEDIRCFVEQKYPNGIDKKEMGLTIKAIKDEFAGADGKMVADIVKSIIH